MSLRRVCDCCFTTIQGSAFIQVRRAAPPTWRYAAIGSCTYYEICFNCWNKAAPALGLPPEEH